MEILLYGKDSLADRRRTEKAMQVKLDGSYWDLGAGYRLIARLALSAKKNDRYNGKP